MGMLDGFFNRISEQAGAALVTPNDTQTTVVERQRHLTDPAVISNWVNPLSYVASANKEGFLKGSLEQVQKIRQPQHHAPTM